MAFVDCGCCVMMMMKKQVSCCRWGKWQTSQVHVEYDSIRSSSHFVRTDIDSKVCYLSRGLVVVDMLLLSDDSLDNIQLNELYRL